MTDDGVAHAELRTTSEGDETFAVTDAEVTLVRPRTRGDCQNGPRPCPWVSCDDHALGARLYPKDTHREIESDNKLLTLLATGPSCILDVADQGGATLEEVGAVFGLTRERIRQIERSGLANLHARSTRRHLDVYLEPDDRTNVPTPRRGHVAARAHEDGHAVPPPATWTGPVGVADVTEPDTVFWCAVVGAGVSGRLCGRRHTATRRGENGQHRTHPLYPTCARCADGAALYARLATATPTESAREAPRVAWFGDTDETPDETETETMKTKIDTTETTETKEVATATSTDACEAKGCDAELGQVRSNTPPAFERLCPGHRRAARHLLRAGGVTPEEAAATLRATARPAYSGTKGPEAKTTKKVKPAKKTKPSKKTVRTVRTVESEPAVLVRGSDLTATFAHLAACVEVVTRLGGLPKAQRLAEVLSQGSLT